MRLGAPLPSRGPAHDPDQPTPGCYRVVLRRGAPASAVRIWLGHGRDEATGEENPERPFFWQAEINGQRVPIESCWPGCAREPISREEHDRLVQRNRTMNEDSVFYDAMKPINLRTAEPPRW